MKHTIVLNNVSKQIKDVEILKDINVKLETGKVYGFIGKKWFGKDNDIEIDCWAYKS